MENKNKLKQLCTWCLMVLMEKKNVIEIFNETIFVDLRFKWNTLKFENINKKYTITYISILIEKKIYWK